MNPLKLLKNWKVMALIGLVAVAGIWWWQEEAKKGGARVDLGYIMEDGTYVPIEPGRAGTVLYFDPAEPFAWYSSSTQTAATRIDGVYGTLSVKVVPVGFEADTVTISWTGWSDAGELSNNGTKTDVPTNQWVTIEESTLVGTSFWYTGGQASVDMEFNVTATAPSGQTATAHAYGSLTIWWGAELPNPSLTLEASVDIGTLKLMA